jgi:hypothetical protein
MSLIGNCDTPDFMFPMTADVFYPMVEQNAYGGVSKTWVLDKTVVGNFSPAGSSTREEVVPNVNIIQNTLMICRVKADLRVSKNSTGTSLTNIIITNIKDSSGNEIYLETAGPRAGKSTVFEIATQEAQIDPFGGGVQYYKVVLRRSDNQGTDV